jgi:hypothetical protein
MIFSLLSIKKNVYLSAGSVPPLSHLTYRTPTKSNLYFEISSTTTLSEPALCMLLTFHVPNLMSILCLGRLSKESVQVRGFLLTELQKFWHAQLKNRPRDQMKRIWMHSHGQHNIKYIQVLSIKCFVHKQRNCNKVRRQNSKTPSRKLITSPVTRWSYFLIPGYKP